MRIRYKQVKESDQDLLEQSAKLVTRMYGTGSHYSKWIKNGFRPFSSEYMLSQVRNPKRQLWVALDKTTVTGTIILQDNGNHALIHKFTIAPEYKGLGKRLLKYGEKLVYKMGFTKIRVEVFSASIKLFNYYVKNHYDQVIAFVPLLEDQYIKYVNPGDYGFITLQKNKP